LDLSRGWDHLVRHLVQEGRLVRPVTEEMTVSEAVQYLMINEKKAEDPACRRFKDWLIAQFK
jgi:DNA-binding transcriptional LysR family regulator